jgi:hypothetical protein
MTEVRLPANIDAAFQTLAQERVELLLIIPEALFLNEHRVYLLDQLVGTHRFRPSRYPSS